MVEVDLPLPRPRRDSQDADYGSLCTENNVLKPEPVERPRTEDCPRNSNDFRYVVLAEDHESDTSVMGRGHDTKLDRECPK